MRHAVSPVELSSSTLSRCLFSLVALASAAILLTLVPRLTAAEEPTPPPGFRAIFNGNDLSGWHGMGHFDPRKLDAMSAEDRAAKRAKDLADLRAHWRVEGGEIVNDGKGVYLTTDAEYGDFELLLDYKTVAKADSGVYLRATPQVQIWDFTEAGGKWSRGADKGSGGLWNNTSGAPGKDPLVLADKPFGEWNHFRILLIGARTSVWLNEHLVVDHAALENFWDRGRSLRPRGPIQLQTHGGEIRWRNVFLREIPAAEAARRLARNDEGFTPIFNGKDLSGWQGALDSGAVRDGILSWRKGRGGVLFTTEEFADFTLRFEFRLPHGGNNGLAIRYPGKGDPAYAGMCELQVLEHGPKAHKPPALDLRQSHGSAYGMAAAQRGFQRPVGEWNYQEVTVRGSTIRVELNGTEILNTDLSPIHDYLDDHPHPGKSRTAGFFGFAGHGDPVEFRNVRIRRL